MLISGFLSDIITGETGGEKEGMRHLHTWDMNHNLPSCLVISKPMPELPPVISATCGCRKSRSLHRLQVHPTP
jgi:hypothetical protein